MKQKALLLFFRRVNPRLLLTLITILTLTGFSPVLWADDAITLQRFNRKQSLELKTQNRRYLLQQQDRLPRADYQRLERQLQQQQVRQQQLQRKQVQQATQLAPTPRTEPTAVPRFNLPQAERQQHQQQLEFDAQRQQTTIVERKPPEEGLRPRLQVEQQPQQRYDFYWGGAVERR